MPASNDFFTPKNSYDLDELVECGYGRLFGPGNAKLPVNNMLMLDRITEISADGGQYGAANSWRNWISGLICGSSTATFPVIRSCPVAWGSMPVAAGRVFPRLERIPR